MPTPNVTKTSEIIANTTTANLFYGNPSVCKLSNGNLIASHDEFGSATTFMSSNGGKSYFYRSTNSGASWAQIATRTGIMGGSVFRLPGSDDLYKIGESHNRGDLVITKSTDGGLAWSVPVDLRTATGSAKYAYQAIQPIIVDGFLIIPISEWDSAAEFPPKRVGAACCAVTDDLTDAGNWTFATSVSDATGFLEFCPVPDGSSWILLGRRPEIHKGVRVAITWDNVTPAITLGTPVIYDQLGGDVMWEVAYHSTRGKYYAICNPHTDWDYGAGDQRNRLELIEATDPAGPWTPIRQIVFNSPDQDSNGSGAAGFQYCGFLRDPDGRLSGTDLVFVSRVGFAPTITGGTGHNSNRVWFHRIANGFNQTRKQWSISKATSLATELSAIADGDLTLTGTAAHESAGWDVVKGANASEPVTSAIGPNVQRASDNRYHTTLDQTAMERARTLGYLIEI